MTDVNGLAASRIPIALAIFGIGMTAGNLLGGHIADSDPARGIFIGFGAALVVLAALATDGGNTLVLMSGLFGVGMTMMIAIPPAFLPLVEKPPYLHPECKGDLFDHGDGRIASATFEIANISSVEPRRESKPLLRQAFLLAQLA